MIPLLYEKDGINKIGELSNCIECLVEEERNGLFELSLIYPITDNIFQMLEKGNVIIANAGDRLPLQKFRIYNVKKLMGNKVEVYANHISYDLYYDIIPNLKLGTQSCEYSLNQIFKNSLNSKHFIGKSDIINSQKFEIESTNCLNAIVGSEGSIVDTFGTGPELLRNNEVISVLNFRGRDNDVNIEYSVNMTDMSVEEDISETYNTIIPYAMYTPTNETVVKKGDISSLRFYRNKSDYNTVSNGEMFIGAINNKGNVVTKGESVPITIYGEEYNFKTRVLNPCNDTYKVPLKEKIYIVSQTTNLNIYGVWIDTNSPTKWRAIRIDEGNTDATSPWSWTWLDTHFILGEFSMSEKEFVNSGHINKIPDNSLSIEEESNNNNTPSEPVTVTGEAVKSEKNTSFLNSDRVIRIDFSDKFDNSKGEYPTKEKLQLLAKKYFLDTKIDMPKLNYKISFIPLSKTTIGGKDDKIELCDIVNVIDTRYDINTKSKVIRTVYDVLKDRYESIELGETRSSLGDIINPGGNVSSGNNNSPVVGPQGPPGQNGTNGVDGENSIYINITNDSHVVPTLSDGTGGNYAGCETTIELYRGADKIVEGVEYEAEQIEGVTASLKGNVYSISNMTVDSCSVGLRATYNERTYIKFFNVSKSKKGADGVTYYTWIRYADDDKGNGISNDPTGKEYIGFAYNKTTPIESNVPGDYTWSLIKGTDGVPGQNGSDGTTYYTWIKYSDNEDGNPCYEVPTQNTKYIGIAVNKTSPKESNDPADYVWSKFKGDDGVDGITYYTWIKYADDINGNGMSNDPLNKDYIGLAHNKPTSEESNNPKDYNWSLIKGTDGVPGQNGIDGKTYYTWIKYSDFPNGDPCYDLPNSNTKYIGIATNKETPTESSNPADYKWSKFRGDDGVDGTTYYTWIRYADDSAGNGISDSPVGKEYIGFAYNKVTQVESNNPKDYTWSLIKGTDGVPGKPGEDGKTYYTWIKYSDFENGNPCYDIPTNNTKYIGIATNKLSPNESDDYSEYKWSKFKGDDGVDGTDGVTYYTWIKYANDSKGNGISNDPLNKAYIGFAYNKTTPVESDNPGDYVWSLIKGTDGVPGKPGADGTTYYTWIKYSDNADGNPCYDTPTPNTKYIGISTNRPTPTETSNPKDYVWSKFRGDDGVNGTNGTNGKDAYTINITNDSHVFASESDGRITKEQTTSTKIIAFKGTSTVTFTIGGLPSVAGLRLSKDSTTVTITALTGNTLADSGSFEIPITIEGLTFKKVFSWSKAKKGQDGSLGDFPDTLPGTPTLKYELYGFANIGLSWTYEDKTYYSYELYASKTRNFTPNSFDLIHAGKSSSFLFQARPNETWYFKVCGINTYGRRTAFSNQVEVTTKKIDNMKNYFEEAAIGSAVVGALTADYMTAGIIKGNWIDAKLLTVTDGNGKRTFEVKGNGDTSINGKIESDSVILANGGIYTNQAVRGRNQSGTVFVGSYGNTVLRSDVGEVYLQTDTEAKVTGASDPNTFKDFRANTIAAERDLYARGSVFAGNNGAFVSRWGYGVVRVDASGQPLYLQCSDEVKCTRPSDPSSYVGLRANNLMAQNKVYANGVALTSSKEYKKNIENYDEDALNEICTTPIRKYHLNTDLDNEMKRIGIILQEAPVNAIDLEGKGVDLYQMVAMSWKAIQQLKEEIEILKNK